MYVTTVFVIATALISNVTLNPYEPSINDPEIQLEPYSDASEQPFAIMASQPKVQPPSGPWTDVRILVFVIGIHVFAGFCIGWLIRRLKTFIKIGFGFVVFVVIYWVCSGQVTGDYTYYCIYEFLATVVSVIGKLGPYASISIAVGIIIGIFRNQSKRENDDDQDRETEASYRRRRKL